MKRRSLAVFLFAGSAFAQEAVPPNRFVPASAQIVMRIKAPAAWHEQFAKTQLAKVFAGAALAPTMKQAREHYPEALDQAAAAGMPREVLQALIEDYRGEMILSVQLDIDAVAANENRERPPFAIMVVLTPDGRFDLAALRAGLRKADEKLNLETSALQIGDHAFRVTKQRTPVAQAELIDGHLVMFAGTAIEQMAPGMLAPTHRSERLPPDAPFGLHVEVGGTIEAIVAAATAHLRAAEMPATPQQILEALGLTNLDAFDASLGAAGEHVALETNLSTRGRSSGVLDTVFVAAKRPTLLRFVPPSVASFSVSAFDFGAAVRAFTAIAALGEGKERLAEMEAAFFEKTKVRLREDLLDLLGSEVMLLGDMRSLVATAIESERDKAIPDPNRLFADYCTGIALRDGKAFAASIDNLLRATGLHAARKTEEYRTTKIHELRLGGAMTIEYAITDDLALFVLGTHGNGSDYLRAALDARIDGKATLAEPITKRTEGLPDGWSGISVMPLVDLVLAFADLGSLRSMNPELSREAGNLMRAVGKELKAIGLGEAVSVSYSSKRGLRTIYRW